jgi:hypothetical protein
MDIKVKKQLEQADKLLQEFLGEIKTLEQQSGGRIQFHVRVPVASTYFLRTTPFTDEGDKQKYIYDIKETEIRAVRHYLQGELFAEL